MNKASGELKLDGIRNQLRDLDPVAAAALEEFCGATFLNENFHLPVAVDQSVWLVQNAFHVPAEPTALMVKHQHR